MTGSLAPLARTLSVVLTLSACTDHPGDVPPPPATPAPAPAPAPPAEPSEPLVEPRPRAADDKAWQGALSSNAGPLARVQVSASLYAQPHCIRAPCDPHNAGALILTADDQGVVRIPLGGGGLIAEPDYAILTVEGYAPLRVELGPTANPVPVRVHAK